MNLTKEQAMDEIAANFTEHILKDEKSLNQFINDMVERGQKNAVQRFFDSLRDFIDRVKKAFHGDQKQMDEAAEKNFSATIGQLERAEQLWKDAAKATAKRTKKAKADVNVADGLENSKSVNHSEVAKKKAQYSQKETSSIKEQLREHQSKLDDKEPVATVQIPDGISKWNMKKTRKWIVETLKPTGFQVDRPGFGIIVFDEKRLNTSLDYLSPGDMEVVAYAALPRVLKRGEEISGHDMHKGREYGTVTIAAPIVLDGQRVNMAVVVKKPVRIFIRCTGCLRRMEKLLIF